MALTSIGDFEVISFSNGRAALENAAAVNPDLILLDVMMPGMDGPDVFRHLAEDPVLARIPVIFMTAKTQKHEVDGYLSLGAIGVIAKPFDPMALPDQIRSICRAV